MLAQVHADNLADRKCVELAQQLETEKLRRQLLERELQVQGLRDANAALSAELQQLKAAHHGLAEKNAAQASYCALLTLMGQSMMVDCHNMCEHLAKKAKKLKEVVQENKGLKVLLQHHKDRFSDLETIYNTTCRDNEVCACCVRVCFWVGLAMPPCPLRYCVHTVAVCIIHHTYMQHGGSWYAPIIHTGKRASHTTRACTLSSMQP